MRQLTKSPKPTLLVQRGQELTSQYQASNGTTRPWSHQSIKEALLEETNKKCAYCEAVLLHVSFGDIEHILPKSKFPQLVAEWNNLTLACSKCNQHKGAKHEDGLEFINPYKDAIEDHLLFLGPTVLPSSDRGDYTTKELQLNDVERIEAREQAIQSLEFLIRRYEASAHEITRKNLWALIEHQCTQGEYTAAKNTYLKLRPIRAQISVSTSELST